MTIEKSGELIQFPLTFKEIGNIWDSAFNSLRRLAFRKFYQNKEIAHSVLPPCRFCCFDMREHVRKCILFFPFPVIVLSFGCGVVKGLGIKVWRKIEIG